MAGSNFDLESYETVDERLRRLYTQFPDARVLTDLVFQDERRFVMKAELYLDRNDMTPVATGWAEEIVGVGFINKNNALENCETSSIGRCIANSVLVLGVPEGKRPSRQEMEKQDRYKETPRKAPVTQKAKIEYTQDQIDKATAIIGTIASIEDVEELRRIWATETEILDIPVNKSTLKDVINTRAKALTK